MVERLEATAFGSYNSVQAFINANAILIENEVLDLSQRGLSSLEGIGAIPGAENVKYLYLNGNLFKEIPEGAFSRYENLEVLDLSDNPLAQVRSEAFLPLTNLKTLLLQSVALTKVPKELLEQNILLEHFSISGPSLSELPEGLLENQSELKTFSASGSSLASLPEKFFWPARDLTSIDLSFNKIATIDPAQFDSLSKLEFIDLSYNKIRQLKKEVFSQKPALKTIMIDENPVASLSTEVLRTIIPKGVWTDVPALVPEQPFSVNDLVDRLKSEGLNIGDALTRTEVGEEDLENRYIVLDLSNRGLTNLDGIEKLPAIFFDEAAHEGGIEHLRGEIDLGKDIRRIILTNNYISTLPDGILQPFPNVREFYARGNRLTAVPPYLFGQGTENWLDDLDLSNNQIERLVTPVEEEKLAEEGSGQDSSENSMNVNPFNSYPHLSKIFLVDNSIKIVPDHIFDKLTFLKEIHLERNRISFLAQDMFAHNPLMEVIHLQDNKLIHLPATLFIGLYSVREIDVSGNMLGQLNQYVFPPNAKLIFDPQHPAPLKVLAAKAYHEKFMRDLGLAQVIK
jgi:insulin-like growth factor-binding protein complex acid labile subunit